MSDAVILRFKTFRCDLTNAVLCEVKAVDTVSGLPLASLPVKQMAEWLQQNGYSWRFGSQGLWERAA